MHVHQCPRCELAFPNEASVKDHMILDHGADAEAIEHRPRGWSRTAPGERTSPDLVHPSPPEDDPDEWQRREADRPERS